MNISILFFFGDSKIHARKMLKNLRQTTHWKYRRTFSSLSDSRSIVFHFVTQNVYTLWMSKGITNLRSIMTESFSLLERVRKPALILCL